MTATRGSVAGSGVPALPSGHPALRRLVATDPDAFARDHWGVEPLLTRSADLPSSFDDLFSEAAVDELVSRRGLRTPFLRMAKGGSTLTDRRFTRSGGTGAGIADQASDEDVLREFADGATLVLQGLHRTWEPVVDFAQQLAADLGHPTQVNAYITPPQNTGFSDHYDVHDVFVLQISGEKRWRIRPPVHPRPLRDQPWTDRREAVELAAQAEPLVETTLAPGDCLYLPRGYLHSATALGGVSTHLTIGVHTWNRHHLAQELVSAALARAAQDPEVRASLPMGADLSDPAALGADVELVRAALARALEDVDAADLTAAMVAASRGSQRAAPMGPLAQHALASSLRDDTALEVRPHLAPTLTPASSGGAVLRSRAGTVRVDEGDVAAVRSFLEVGTATAGHLGLDLARRLVLAGIAVAA
ncbi:JmjC domain-containing protein [Phycicoccus sp. Soil748]|uniref:JmjC domain-containing protein n=1 Tax=Phycicoccus sp. Soil748 TaxID=1736397 RepID=UPI0007032536|nr:cupin domain-containing protein [Phycicoccus sp. Soil748]KRE54573.1 cupin [Phycicoccus sp. Soil748]